jgi:ABC-type uncharacterized transport system substrate-binding protein
VKAGALVTISRDYHEAGRESALIAARVMRGENRIDSVLPMSKNRTIVNRRRAGAQGDDTAWRSSNAPISDRPAMTV